MERVLLYLLAMTALPYVLMQSRRPGRGIGRVFLWAMNLSHSPLTDWGLSHVTIGKRSTILDVGCGGGRTIQKLAAIATEGTVHGVDYSRESVATARAKNAGLVKTGRVDVRHASVSHLPFPDDLFDLVVAVETHYYWPDLANDLREVLRVLRPGGTFAIVAETYKGGRFDALHRPVMKLLRSAHLSIDEHGALLSSAGFADVETFEERSKNWMCTIGRKPASARIPEPLRSDSGRLTRAGGWP